MGDLVCLDSATGVVVWQKNFVRDYHAEVPLYGFASPPLVDGDRLIVMVGGEGQVVMALDRHTGRELWKSGTASEPGYCPPLIRTLAGRRQLIIWHADELAGLEPESGKQLWSVPHHIKVGVAISTPAVEGNRLAVCSQYEGADAGFRPGTAVPRSSALPRLAGTTMAEGRVQFTISCCCWTVMSMACLSTVRRAA
jgi:outer membrane protein assembly factor BamB